jgi:hypothetical protein
VDKNCEFGGTDLAALVATRPQTQAVAKIIKFVARRGDDEEENLSGTGTMSNPRTGDTVPKDGEYAAQCCGKKILNLKAGSKLPACPECGKSPIEWEHFRQDFFKTITR